MKQLSATELKVTQKVSVPDENGSTSRRQEVKRASVNKQTASTKSSQTRATPSVQQSQAATTRGKTLDLPLSPQQLKNQNAKTSQKVPSRVVETYSPSASVQTNVAEPSIRVGPRQAKSNKHKEKIAFVPAPPSEGNNDVTDKMRRSHRAKHRHRSTRLTKALTYGVRLAILGIGIGAIAGTVLSALDPTNRISAQHTQAPTPSEEQVTQAALPGSALKLSQEMVSLKTTVQQLAAKQKGLTPGAFFFDVDTGAYLDVNGNSTFASASMIKFPVLVAFFQDVDAGKIRLDEKLTLKKELIGGGAGEMQYKPIGSKFTALETATKMIKISDNTATNLLINRLGGATALNQRFISWGLTTTQIRNLLPDLEGTNTTSPRDLAQLMGLVNQGGLMSMRSRDRLLDIMQQTVTNTLLPRGLGEGATIAHKTGDIGSLVGDVGLVDMPNGKRYIAVAMVKRPHNDGRAQELIRQISRATYQEFNKANVDQVLRTTPFVTTSPPGANSASGTPSTTQ